MTDSDDPSRRSPPPPAEGAAPSLAELAPGAAPSLADLARAEAAAGEDPDDPPLASPDDVLASPEDAPSAQTTVEPALTVSTQVLETGAPAEPERHEVVEPVVSTRLSAASVGTEVVPRRARVASVVPRAEGEGVGAASTQVSAASVGDVAAASAQLASAGFGAASVGAASAQLGAQAPSPSGAHAPSTQVSASSVRAPSTQLSASPLGAPSTQVSASSVRAPSTQLSASPLGAPAQPASLAPRERAPSSAPRASASPPPAASPAFLPHVAPFSERPSQPPASAAAAPEGSVWTVVGPPPEAAPEPRSLLGSASSMTSARDVLSRGTGATSPRVVQRADEADTLGMGTPMPTLPLATAPLPATPHPDAAPTISGGLPSLAEAARAAAAEAARTLPSNTTKVTAAQVVDSRRLPEATTLREAPPFRDAAPPWRDPATSRDPSAFREAPPPPPRDTLVTSASDPRGREADDTIGVAAPAPRGGSGAGQGAGRPPPPRNLGAQIFAWAAVAMMGGIVLGGGCMACLGAGGGGDEREGGGGPHVAVVDLAGPIMDGTITVRELRRFARQGDIQAIVVRIDSPGGAVAPSQEIFDAMRAASKEKPVVVSMGTVAASGGFWAAMAGDWIVASPGSITGSIGVISQTPDLRGLAELLRVDLKTYKSGPYKDAGNPLRAPQPGDEAVHMELISDVYDQFVTVISERRKIELDAVRRFADGRIFTGRRAHELGLVDQLGGLYDAAQHALVLVEERRAKAANEPPEPVEDEPTLVYPRRPSVGLLRLLSEEAGEGAAAGAGRVIDRALDVTGRDPRIELR